MDLPVVFQYQRALDVFRREGREPPLLKRMSELISLLDLTTTLNSPLSRDEILESALLIVMGEFGARRGALFVRNPLGPFELRASRGMTGEVPCRLLDGISGEDVLLHSSAGGERVSALGLEALCPVRKGDRTIAYIGIGRRADESPYSEIDATFLRSVAACAATPIENGLIYEELRRLNQKLEISVFQLRNLFEISRELIASLDEEAIQSLVTTTLMGHLLVSRCALYLEDPSGLVLAHGRGGVKSLPERVQGDEARSVLSSLSHPRGARELPEGSLRKGLVADHFNLCVPLSLGGPPQGFLAVGERASGAPFTEEDLDFASTLARQALAALETVRLHQVRLAKQRQDRELQIARQIQQSLFPRTSPRIAGFDMAAASLPCEQVGGDLYDLIALGETRAAVVIADVSGKGTPASLLMASLHAHVRALAGTLPPMELIRRLNRFLCESTEDNKYVTMFYGELEAESKTLAYVNAGHVPPLLVRARGGVTPLLDGGPVVGLFENAEYELGKVELRPGDVLAMVTDGATEALSPSDEEFGDRGILAALEKGAGSARELVSALIDAVHLWTGEKGCADDLTALVLKALP